ncbi:MAG TPA: hypothetical protein VIL74_25870 [Pyrinomonadaceae bacterium]|jgi:hypothetical protein
MNKPKFIFKAFLFLLVLSAANVFAQENRKEPQADPCYEVVLQILVASNNAGEKTTLPAALSGVVKKLKTNYSFADYRLAATFLQRTSNSIEYKSLLSDFAGLKDNTAPVFSDWSLRNLRNLPTAAGRSTIQFESFRFGARIPIVASFRDESGKTAPVVNYEAIGVTTTRFSLNENEPTVVGSLTTPKPDELMFLVLTVKPAE